LQGVLLLRRLQREVVAVVYRQALDVVVHDVGRGGPGRRVELAHRLFGRFGTGRDVRGRVRREGTTRQVRVGLVARDLVLGRLQQGVLV